MRILITGSTEGLGRAAALALLDDGHDVILHARNPARADGMGRLAERAAGVVIGDLASAEETRALAGQVNAIGRMDAVIHNAGIYIERVRGTTPEGHARTLAVNVLAPYLLTAEIERPARLVYISSDMHAGGDSTLRDIDWTARPWDGVQAYRDSKLFVAALGFAIARRWPEVRTAVVDPGWVPTRMGGPQATDDLQLGHVTQAWLAVSDEQDAAASGAYWYHGQRQAPAAAVADVGFQSALLDELDDLTGVHLP